MFKLTNFKRNKIISIIIILLFLYPAIPNNLKDKIEEVIEDSTVFEFQDFFLNTKADQVENDYILNPYMNVQASWTALGSCGTDVGSPNYLPTGGFTGGRYAVSGNNQDVSCPRAIFQDGRSIPTSGFNNFRFYSSTAGAAALVRVTFWSDANGFSYHQFNTGLGWRQHTVATSSIWGGTAGTITSVEFAGLSTCDSCITFVDQVSMEAAPPVIITPAGITVEYATSGTFSRTWSVTDADGDLDWVAVDDATGGYDYSSGGANFYDGTITGGADSLITAWTRNEFLGTKTYRGQVGDVGGRTDTTTDVLVTIEDTTAPVITVAPSHSSYEAPNPTTINIQWTATDYLAGTYIIERQVDGGGYSTVRSATSWTTGVAIAVYDVSGLSGGTWDHRITFSDTSSNTAQEVHTTTVTSAAKPTSNAPSNINFEYGPSPPTQTIAWTWTDNYNNPTDSGIWEVRKSDDDPGAGACTSGGGFETQTAVSAGSTNWEGTSGSRNEDVTDQAQGTDWYCIRITDEAGNWDNDTVQVTASTATPPTWSVALPDFAYEEGNSQGRVLYWEFFGDADGNTWVIRYQATAFVGGVCTGGTIENSGTWTGLSESQTSPDVQVGGFSTTRYYCARVDDLSGNFIDDTVDVVVYTATAPTSSSPTDINYEDGNTDVRNVQWTITEQFPDTYIIERRLDGGGWSTVRTATAYSNGVPTAVFDVGSLTVGTWEFRINASESLIFANGAWVTDTMVVIVSTGEAPQITSTPSNTDYEEGNTDVRNIQWTATDSYPSTYIIERRLNGGSWSTVRTTTAWTSGVAIATYDIGSLTVGSWEFRINFTETSSDASGLGTTHTITITVAADSAPIITVNPSDTGYEDGNTDTRNVQWTATDSYPDTYIIEWRLNGAGGWSTATYGRTATTWTSGVAIAVFDVGSLTVGSWEFRINFTETTSEAQGRTTSDIMVVTVAADSAPIIIASPSDADYEAGNTDTRNVQWTATDSYPDTYIIEWRLNGAGGWSTATYGRTTTAWTSGVAIAVFDVGSLTVGSWEFRINFTETTSEAQGRTTSDIMVVTVAANSIPIIIASPSTPVNYEDGNTDTRNVQWTATDSYPDTYIIESRLDGGDWDTERTQTAWADGVAITVYDVGSLTAGTWDIKITFTETLSDAQNRTITDTIQIIVSISTIPQFTSPPSDQTKEWTDASINNIVWTFTDNEDGATWNIKLSTDNSSWGGVLSSGVWAGVSGSSDAYDVGTPQIEYYYRIEIIDQTTNANYDYIHVSIYSKIERTAFQLDQTGNTINEQAILMWKASHYQTLVNAEIWRNTTQIETIAPHYNNTWNVYDLTIGGTLVSGSYDFIIKSWDSDNELAIASFPVAYLDNSPNIYLPPADYSYTAGAINNEIRWGVLDRFSDTYAITRNGSQVDSGNWDEGSYISLAIDGLTANFVYEYVLTVYDIGGNSATDTTYVTVYPDQDNPLFSSTPDDYLMAFGTTPNTIEWVMSDISSGTYILYRNGSNVASGSWQPATILSLNIDGLSIDTLYNYTLVVLDDYDNGNQDQVWVYVQADDGAPTIIVLPSDFGYTVGSTGNTLRWAAIDNFETTIIIKRNGTTIFSGAWSSSDYVILNIDGLEANVYSYQIWFYDTSLNSATDTVLVTVT